MLLGLLALLVVVLVAALVQYVREQARTTTAAWSALAARHGGHFDPKSGPWYSRTRLVLIELEHTPLRIDHYTESSGETATPYTRLRARAPGSEGLELKVFPRHALTGLSRALGFQDVSIGDATFDEAFVVKANDEDRARAWLSGEVREAIRRAAGYQFALKGGELTVTKAILENDTNALERVAQATATMASRGQRIREGWRRFAAEHDGQVTSEANGRLRIELEGTSAPLRIATEGDGRRTNTRIESRVVGGHGEPFDFAADAEAAALDSELSARLEKLSPLVVQSDGERVNVVLEGVVTDEERLESACELAQQLAKRRGASYR